MDLPMLELSQTRITSNNFSQIAEKKRERKREQAQEIEKEKERGKNKRRALKEQLLRAAARANKPDQSDHRTLGLLLDEEQNLKHEIPA